MKKLVLVVLASVSLLTLASCGTQKVGKTNGPVAFKKCLETESRKLLDETGSNLEYANEKATKTCQRLK
jgi:hypothetical protein